MISTQHTAPSSPQRDQAIYTRIASHDELPIDIGALSFSVCKLSNGSHTVRMQYFDRQAQPNREDVVIERPLTIMNTARLTADAFRALSTKSLTDIRQGAQLHQVLDTLRNEIDAFTAGVTNLSAVNS